MVGKGYWVQKSGHDRGEGAEMASSTISYLWRDPNAPKGFRSGVSLHGHTNQSRETLDFLANFGNQYPTMRPLLSRLERRGGGGGGGGGGDGARLRRGAAHAHPAPL